MRCQQGNLSPYLAISHRVIHSFLFRPCRKITEENYLDGKQQTIIHRFICSDSFTPAISHQLLVPSLNMTDDTSDSFKASMTERYCSSLLDQHLPFDFKLPAECHQFSTVNAKLQRKKSSQVDASIAFAGLSPAEAAQAQVARERGRPHEAQIKRRLTSTSKDSSSSWF
jgi:hypothetical protein